MESVATYPRAREVLQVNDVTLRTLFVFHAPLMSFAGARLFGLFGVSWERAR